MNCVHLIQDCRVVKVNLLANQILAVEHENQNSLNFYRLSGRRNASPWAAVCSAESAFDNDCVCGMMNGRLTQMEIGECRQKGADQSRYRFRSVCNRAQGGNFIPWVAERS